jgi:type IV secretory pathway TrbL component
MSGNKPPGIVSWLIEHTIGDRMIREVDAGATIDEVSEKWAGRFANLIVVLIVLVIVAIPTAAFWIIGGTHLVVQWFIGCGIGAALGWCMHQSRKAGLFDK